VEFLKIKSCYNVDQEMKEWKEFEFEASIETKSSETTTEKKL